MPLNFVYCEKNNIKSSEIVKNQEDDKFRLKGKYKYHKGNVRFTMVFVFWRVEIACLHASYQWSIYAGYNMYNTP